MGANSVRLIDVDRLPQFSPKPSNNGERGSVFLPSVVVGVTAPPRLGWTCTNAPDPLTPTCDVGPHSWELPACLPVGVTAHLTGARNGVSALLAGQTARAGNRATPSHESRQHSDAALPLCDGQERPFPSRNHEGNGLVVEVPGIEPGSVQASSVLLRV